MSSSMQGRRVTLLPCSPLTCQVPSVGHIRGLPRDGFFWQCQVMNGITNSCTGLTPCLTACSPMPGSRRGLRSFESQTLWQPPNSEMSHLCVVLYVEFFQRYCPWSYTFELCVALEGHAESMSIPPVSVPLLPHSQNGFPPSTDLMHVPSNHFCSIPSDQVLSVHYASLFPESNGGRQLGREPNDNVPRYQRTCHLFMYQ